MPKGLWLLVRPYCPGKKVAFGGRYREIPMKKPFWNTRPQWHFSWCLQKKVATWHPEIFRISVTCWDMLQSQWENHRPWCSNVVPYSLDDFFGRLVGEHLNSTFQHLALVWWICLFLGLENSEWSCESSRGFILSILDFDFRSCTIVPGWNLGFVRRRLGKHNGNPRGTSSIPPSRTMALFRDD